MSTKRPSTYEETALVAIHEWKHPTLTWWDSAMKVINAPIDAVGDAAMKIIQRIAKARSIRLTKAKLAQVLPAAGAAIGGGFNAYYTSEVCDAACFLYRERFLARKYGEDVIEVTVEPARADDFGDGYETDA